MLSWKQNKKANRRKIFSLFFLVLAFSFCFFVVSDNYVSAQITTNEAVSTPSAIRMVLDKILEKVKKTALKVASSALNKIVTNSVNKIAYDTAVWVGSGAKGQGPQFYQDGWGTFLGNARDEAISSFVETLSSTSTTPFSGTVNTKDGKKKVTLDMDFCNPDLSAKLKIGLGLYQYNQPPKPSCTWSEMKKNWSAAVQRKDYLKEFANSFDPTANDLGVALTVNSLLIENINNKEKTETLERSVSGGWLNLRDIGGSYTTTPDNAKMQLQTALNTNFSNIGKFTGDALVDAANVFLNQLAITGLQTALNRLTSNTPKGQQGSSVLTDFNAAPVAQGEAGTRDVLRKVVEPRFDSRGDYDILAELSTCNKNPDGVVPPTGCVIDDKFSQAISEKKTLAEAIKEGYLRSDLPFGFSMSGGNAGTPVEPSYLEGLPYRSMLILRKYRIIPVGWELAAQKIALDSTEARNHATLQEMMDCFSPEDSYNKSGYQAEWCRGLVDPDWVFKAPQNYCAKEGFGPQIIFKQSIAEGDGQPPKLTINRADNYCASEQSCIKERGDGSCEYYGYCSEEKRKWVFGSDSCEPIYNSCQSFTGEQGGTISFLKNTLQFCSPENYGCAKYSRAAGDSYPAEGKSENLEKNPFNPASSGYTYWANSGPASWQANAGLDRRGKNEASRYYASQGYRVNLKQWTGLAPNTGYNFSAYIKANGAYGMVRVGGNGYIPTDNWEKVSALGTSDKNGNLNIGFDTWNDNVVDVLITEVRMEKVSSLIDWAKSSQQLYLNNRTEACDGESEGCHEFIRAGAGLGANLIATSSFENIIAGAAKFGWPITGAASITETPPEGFSGQAVLVEAKSSPAGLYSFDHSASGNASVLPLGFVFEPEVSYTLSARVYLETGDRVALGIGREGQTWKESETAVKGKVQNLSVTLLNNPDVLANEIRIFGFGSGDVKFYIDNIKLEIGNKATPFDEYRGGNLVYEKLLPVYLENSCYVDFAKGDFRLKENAPASCKDFARKCNRDEAGCELFTALSGESEIPAAVKDKDYCAAECAGYNTFIQSANNFSSKRAEYFIPQTAKACSAAQIGCEEFTNLDNLTGGAESKEYYSYLRSCVKPAEANSNCAEFYTWEGSDVSGRQLVKYSLSANGSQPLITEDDSALCNETIYNYAADNFDYNSDCRQFYSRDGQISYHLYSRTISCTENCHPYRLTKNNIEPSLNMAGCLNNTAKFPGKYHWDAANNACYQCLGGGLWNDEQQACLYKATTPESVSCSAENSGCAEYSGNQGNNLRVVLFSSFEKSADNWTGGEISKTAVAAGQSSYKMKGGISYAFNDIDKISKGGSYALSFLVKGAVNETTISADLSNGADRAYFDSVKVRPNEWQVIKMNLKNLSYDPSFDEVLNINGASGLYIDDIKLAEITDHYYLVRNSWNTPEVCDQDENGNPFPYYALGCAGYNDRFNNTHFLHSFSRVCQESAVGCEVVIDTQNSASQNEEIFTKNDGTSIKVPADRFAYVVYDPEKTCQSADKGCERLGKASDYENATFYQEVFLKNNPDKYDSILCEKDGLGCDKWSSEDGDAYFKNPGNMVCEWRQGTGTGKSGEWNWFKKKVNRCNGDKSACSNDFDCAVGQKCQLENYDTLCPSAGFKTFGFGGLGNEIKQPANENNYNWAGLCPAAQSGCSEYIDPVSDFSANAVFNFDFSRGSGLADGWEKNSLGGLNAGKQNIRLEGNNLYILTVEGANSAAININAAGVNPFFELDAKNNLPAQGANSISVPANSSKVFYIDNTVQDELEVENALAGNKSRIKIKKAVIDYQLKNSIDKQTCNGAANASDGCIVFNERLFGAGGLAELTKDAQKIYDSKNSGGGNNANQILKVRPDRVCSQWLSCKSYIKDENNQNVCFDIASCDRLDPNGNCANFVASDSGAQTSLTYSEGQGEKIKNLSGYAKAGWSGADLGIIPNNLYSLGVMKQVGANVIVSNGDFEMFDEKAYAKPAETGRVARPNDWNPKGIGIDWSTSTAAQSSFSVIADPILAERQGVKYPMIGRSFLRYNAYRAENFPVSGVIYINPGEYYLSYYINTLKLRGNNSQQTEAYIKVVDGANKELAVFSQEMSKDWELKTEKIAIPAGVKMIKLELGASSTDSANPPTGDVYIDNIQISPVLLVQGSGSIDAPGDDAVYAGQTCRLYPEEDSLSCDYYDEAGALQKGERGYCLEYDRYPGDPNTCLLWWPIDKVKGSGLQSKSASSGYSGRMPLYYCLESNNQAPYIDASEVSYAIDEYFNMTVNDKLVTQSSRHGNGDLGWKDGDGDAMEEQQGTLSGRTIYPDNKIPLKYGMNTIKLFLKSGETAGGRAFFRFSGIVTYMDQDRQIKKQPFNINNLISSGNASVAVETNCWNSSGIKISDCSNFESYKDHNSGFWKNGESLLVSKEADSKCDNNHFCDNGTDEGERINITYTVYVPELICNKLVNVVSIDGRNKAWAERIKMGSDYNLPCNAGIASASLLAEPYVPQVCSSTNKAFGDTNYSSPFGAIVPPKISEDNKPSLSFLGDPTQWAGKNDSKPLPYYYPFSSTGGLAGQIQLKDYLPGLFSESYGVWNWSIAKQSYVLSSDQSDNWNAPQVWCGSLAGNIGKNSRPSANANCAVAPEISNIKANNSSMAYVFGRGFVNLTFNSKIDSQQTPLTAYEIDWGDGEKLTVSGVEMQDKQYEDKPHSVFHSYDYYDLKAKLKNGGKEKYPNIFCDDSKPANCKIKPRIKITDNWNWCSEGRQGISCPIASNNAARCVSANREANPSNSTPCKNNKDCGGTFPICSDGYYELSGEVIVYK